MKIEIHIDATGMRDQLAPIEAGGPQRLFRARSIADAVALGNAVLFAAGQAMRSGPRKLANLATYTLSAPDSPVIVRILRRD